MSWPSMTASLTGKLSRRSSNPADPSRVRLVPNFLDTRLLEPIVSFVGVSFLPLFNCWFFMAVNKIHVLLLLFGFVGVLFLIGLRLAPRSGLKGNSGLGITRFSSFTGNLNPFFAHVLVVPVLVSPVIRGTCDIWALWGLCRPLIRFIYVRLLSFSSRFYVRFNGLYDWKLKCELCGFHVSYCLESLLFLFLSSRCRFLLLQVRKSGLLCPVFPIPGHVKMHFPFFSSFFMLRLALNGKDTLW